jgi:hypothetical protein
VRAYAISVQVSGLLVLCSSAVFGQGSSGSFSAGAGPFRGTKGAPYCAVEETEQSQTLSDGTHITQKVHRTKICRDSEGRTGREDFFLLAPEGSETPSMILSLISTTRSSAHSKESAAASTLFFAARNSL